MFLNIIQDKNQLVIRLFRKMWESADDMSFQQQSENVSAAENAPDELTHLNDSSPLNTLF